MCFFIIEAVKCNDVRAGVIFSCQGRGQSLRSHLDSLAKNQESAWQPNHVNCFILFFFLYPLLPFTASATSSVQRWKWSQLPLSMVNSYISKSKHHLEDASRLSHLQTLMKWESGNHRQPRTSCSGSGNLKPYFSYKSMTRLCFTYQYHMACST